jgi:hypothetical protein
LEVLGPEAEAVGGDGVFGVEEALDGAGEGGVSAIFEGELGGAESEVGVEAGGVGGEEVVDGGAGLVGGEPGVDEELVGEEVVGMVLEVAAPEDGGLHGGEGVAFDLEAEAEGGEVGGGLLEAMFEEAAGAVGVLLLVAGFGEGEGGGGLVGGGGGFFEAVEEVEHFGEAVDAGGGGEDGEEFGGGDEGGEVEAEFDGASVLLGFGAGVGEAVEPEEVGGIGGGGGGEFAPVELVLGVVAEEGFDGGDEGGGVLGEAGEGPGEVEGFEIWLGLILDEGSEEVGGFVGVFGSEVKVCEGEAGGVDLFGVVRGRRVVEPIAEEGDGFVGHLGGNGVVDEGLDMSPGGGGVAGGFGEEVVLHAGLLVASGAGGEGLEEMEAERVGFVEGEFLEEGGGDGEGRREVADEGGFEEGWEEGGVEGEGGIEEEVGALVVGSGEPGDEAAQGIGVGGFEGGEGSGGSTGGEGGEVTGEDGLVGGAGFGVEELCAVLSRAGLALARKESDAEGEHEAAVDEESGQMSGFSVRHKVCRVRVRVGC